MREIGEIKAADKAFRNDTNFLKLKKRWETDFNLYRLKPYDAGKGYYSYTSNSPRILATRSMSMLTSSKLIIRIPLDTLAKDERLTANNIERLLYGMLTMNDDRYLAMNMPSVVEQLAWHAIIRGGVAIRPLIYKNEKGETVIEIAVWDLYNTSYGMGANGTAWATHTRTAKRDELEKLYGVKIAGKNDIEVLDHWDDKENGVFANNQWLKNPTGHGLDYCPVFILQVGSMPHIGQDTYQYTDVHRGESIFSMNRDEYPMMNKVLSDYATIVRRGVKTPLGYWSAGGSKTLDQDIYQVEKAATVQLDSLTNEKIEPLLEPSMPVDAKALVEIISGEEQRGGLSHVALGELGFRLSGFAINQLVANISTIIEPYIVCVEKALKVSMLTLLSQYASGKYPDVKVRGRDSKKQSFGFPEALTIKSGDIKGDWHPELRLEPIMPKDDAQKYQLAHLARQDRTLSLDTIQDSMLGVDDPAAEQEKMAREFGNDLIINRLYAAYEAYVADGDQMRADNTRMELQRLLASQQPQQGEGQEQAGISGLEAASMENPGTGVPPDGVGLPSSTLPSEALDGFPPGAKGAT